MTANRRRKAEAATAAWAMLAAVQESVAQGRGRALVAEDNPLNYEFVADVLDAAGWDVEWARDGRETVAALLGETFDLLLLDIHMPDVDGLQVLEMLGGSTGARIAHRPRVIVLTADLYLGLDGDLLARGADGVLTKPFRLSDFNSVLAATHIAR